jgi:hypothetical protein
MKASDTVSPTFRFSPLWIAAVAALLLGALAAGVLYVTSSSRASQQQHLSPVAQNPSPSAAPVSSEDLAAAPVASVTPFVCTSSKLSVASAPPVANINAVRTGTHAGYDRLVIQFAGKQPGNIELRPQATASFSGAPSGAPTVAAGAHGIKVLINVADMHTYYSGARSLKTNYIGLRETRVIEDFEGYVALGLGVNGSNCYRAFVLTNPTRLVVDIQTS